MSDFPRGWTLSVDNAAAAASIVVPAIAGVAHVLDAFDAKLQNTSAALQGSIITLSSSDGVFSGFVLGRLSTSTPAASSLTTDEVSGSGLDLAAGPGASLTIAFASWTAGMTETLRIQGHDI